MITEIKADYKAICKQTFELDRAVSDLESRAFDEFKGHKTGMWFN